MGSFDWTTFFGNDNPVELDIGCGRGLFLVTAGEANPDVNYLGIEIDYGEGRRAATRLQRRQLSNVRVLGGDVFRGLTELIQPGSVSAVHVYFPDPWWKRRHRQRRIFNRRFIDLCVTALQPGGLLHSWTDVEEYFGVISSLMEQDPRFETLPALLNARRLTIWITIPASSAKHGKSGNRSIVGAWRLVENGEQAHGTN